MLQLIQIVPLLVFPALVLTAAGYDAMSYKIPNWVSIALAAAFVPAMFAAGLTPVQIGVSFAVGGGVFLVCLGMFAMNWVGGGDAKLISAASLWLGMAGLFPFLASTAIVGGGVALLLLTMRSRMLRPMFQGAGGWVGRLATPGQGVPYALAIAAGALLAFPQSLPGKALFGLF